MNTKVAVSEAETDSPKSKSDEPGTEQPRRSRQRWRTIVFHVCIVALNLTIFELALRFADFRDLRLIPEQHRLPYDHDPELGWFPMPNKVMANGVRINSIGLRDIEIDSSAKPTLLFVGDSFVYGLGVKTEERFTERLRQELPDYRIVNAGVAAYGTDQEYLLLKRLWPIIKPRAVVLIVCVDNDHEDNSTNARHGHTLKPYLAKVDGEWRFQGLPVPRHHKWYYYNNWLAAHFATVRLAIEAYSYLRYPGVEVPDPTAPLVGMMRDLVESHGAKFLVGLQHGDPALEPYLQSQKIPYIRFDGVATIPNDDHWSAEGHATVAQRLMTFFAAEKVLSANANEH